MNSSPTRRVLWAALLLFPLLWPGPVLGQQTQSAEVDEKLEQLERQVEELQVTLQEMKEGRDQTPEIKELERRIELLARELERLRIGEEAVEATTSVHGLGPSASKIYHKSKGVSIGGYGEVLYENFADDRDDGTPSGKSDQIDLLRAVFYFGYRFNERILFNSELEYEHAATSEEGSVAVEFAYLDFLFKEKVNARAGLVLVPMGFVNELHEPPIFLGSRRPDVERVLIPTTWRSIGAGIFGDLGPVSYRAYVVDGFDGAGIKGSGFSAANGLRGGRQKGSKALAEDFALVARADWQIIPSLSLGGSFYIGSSGQGAVAPSTGETIDARTEILDLHAEYRWRGLQARGLWVDVSVDQADLINDFQDPNGVRPPTSSVGERMEGGYLELGYDVLSQLKTKQSFIPFIRHEKYNTQSAVPAGFASSPANDVTVATYGVSYLPIRQVVIKLDYQNYGNAAGTGTDQWNVALGWLF